jgi:hypothetical protein
MFIAGKANHRGEITEAAASGSREPVEPARRAALRLSPAGRDASLALEPSQRAIQRGGIGIDTPRFEFGLQCITVARLTVEKEE